MEIHACIRKEIWNDLELILNLSRDMGVNLAGVDIILNLREKMSEMQLQINEMVKFLKGELERKDSAQPEEPGQRGIVKSPAANLIRMAQHLSQSNPARLKR